MARIWSVLVVWFLCALGSSAQDQQRPSDDFEIAGEWQLNASLSDAVPLLPGEAVALARASGVLPTSARPVRAAGGPDPLRRTAVRLVLRAEFGAEQLKIDHAGGTVTLTYGDGHALSTVPDGRKAAIDQGGVRARVVSRWSPPLLTVEREYEDGTLLTETYATFDRPRQLVATATIHTAAGQRDPVTFTRVFEVTAR